MRTEWAVQVESKVKPGEWFVRKATIGFGRATVVLLGDLWRRQGRRVRIVRREVSDWVVDE